MLLSLVLLFTLVVILSVAWLLKVQNAGRHLPPGPRPLPLIGNVWTINCQEAIAQLAETYGNIYTVWLGQTPVVVLSGFQAVKEALILHSEELSGRPHPPLIRDLIGNRGIIFSSGHTWKQQRRFVIMTLKKLGLGTTVMEGRIWDEACHLLQFFKDQKGHAVDPSMCLTSSMGNVICAVCFGRRFSIGDVVFCQLFATVELLFEAHQKIWSRIYDMFPWLVYHLPGPHKKMFRYSNALRTFIKEEIRSHQQNLTDEPQDMMGFYIKQMSASTGDPSSTYDEENLIQVVADLFMAGTEGPAVTLRWALLYMVIYPDIQEKVQEELDAVLGPAQFIKYEDRKRLPHTNAVIHEIQRYKNIMPIGPLRQCLKRISFQGIAIEKGTIILPDLTSVLNDPDQWETPRLFNPGHFLDENGTFTCREAFLPFSTGHRVCLGEQLARTELFLFFSSLLRAFTFRLPEGVTEVNTECVCGTVVKPAPYKLCAIPR